MAQSIRLKFTLDAGDVDFYADEVLAHKLTNTKDFQIQENRTGAPYILYEGNANEILEVTFQEFYSTTRAKIDQLIDEQAEMTVYYEYDYDTSNSLSMILYNKKNTRRTKIYKYGERAGNVIHKLIFIQSS